MKNKRLTTVSDNNIASTDEHSTVQDKSFTNVNGIDKIREDSRATDAS